MSGARNGALGARLQAVAVRWIPYFLAAAGLFVAAATVGAAVGTERESFVVPVRSPSDPVPELAAGSLFGHNAGIALGAAGGVLLLGLPTLFLLAYNGFLFGSTMVDAAGSLGPLRTVALVAPHGVLELPAVWLAGAVGLRWTHLLWRLANGASRTGDVPRTVVDSLAAVALALLVLAVAAVVEASVTLPLARALT